MSLATARELADRQLEKRLGEEYVRRLSDHCRPRRAPETESIEIASDGSGEKSSLVRYLSVGTDLSSATRIYVDDTLEFEDDRENFEDGKTAEEYLADQTRKEKFWRVAGINSDAVDTPIYLRLRQLEIVPCVAAKFDFEKRGRRHSKKKTTTSRKLINDLRPGNKYVLVPTTALAYVIAVNKIPYGKEKGKKRRRRSSRSRSPVADVKKPKH